MPTFCTGTFNWTPEYQHATTGTANTFDEKIFVQPIEETYIPRFITQEDLDDLCRRIYRIIEEHAPIDISEEEFMKLLKENDNE